MKSQLINALKKLWPHAAIVLLFVVLSCAYFAPVLEGKVLPQGDNTHSTGAARELYEYEQANGSLPQWTNSMFGGMPAYQVRADNNSNIFRTFDEWSRLGLPYTTIAILFLYMVGFYLLMVSMKMNRWLSVLGAVAFAFGSYNLIIIAAGHITKAYAIALSPLVLGGAVMIFKGKKVAGAVLTMVALGMQLAYNHVQITYYLALTIGVMVIAKLICAVREKQLADFGKAVGALCAAVVLAIIPSTVNLWTTYEYGAYSIRGKSELKAAEGEQQSSGLDKDYALSWSYGVGETPTLLVPNVVGGASEAIAKAPGSNKALQKADPRVRENVAQGASAYWGGRPFTSGPVYVGAVMCFLFFIGLFYYQGKERWWLLAATILSIVLAWGKNFPLLTDFMFYHFPFYNKFRTVEMTLVIATITIPMLGLLGLKELYNNPERVRYEPGKFFAAMGLSGGVALVLALVPTLFYNFLTPDEEAQFAQLIAQDQQGIYSVFRQGIIDVREALCTSDAWRSVVLVVLASSALWFFSVRKINARIAMTTLIALIIIDLWFVDKRYLSAENFVTKQVARGDFKKSVADEAILADPAPHRVMSLYTNPFNEVFTSYYHQSVGGYHGAKLRRYQDVIEHYLTDDWQKLTSAVREQNYEAIQQSLSEAQALNMLNTKYLIYNPAAQPLVNPYAQGAAWFVQNVTAAASPDEALAALATTDLRSTAIVEAENITTSADSTAQITRTHYSPNRVVYSAQTNAEALAVFSEIYYPAGWKAFIDGEETQIVRANYILRAAKIPSGTHEIEFRFEPTSYHTGRIVAYVGSGVVCVIIIGFLFFSFRRKAKENQA